MSSHFTPLMTPHPSKIDTQALRSSQTAVLKDNFTITTWLALGATLNGLLFLSIGRIALIIPVVLLLAKTTDALLMVYGLKRNSWANNVINTKFSAQIPEDDGTYGPTSASSGVTVLLIGARSNHPMGILAPGFKEVGDYMIKMQKDSSARAQEYGLLASSAWMSTERDSSNEVMYVMYFRNTEGLHKYAHDDLHRQAWNWWNKTYKQHEHISIWHEVFAAPAKSWETLYANSHPTLLAAASVDVKTETGTQFFSPIVDASRGLLKSAKGRMAWSDGKDNDRYGQDPFQGL
ncbi:hypothetical protein BT63DRAFT_424047 [Microthyrium microscopicum]|uniref:Monooxygenase n=1 Tax=Microthyrium microscopicum TaxID=703497 RepID=A0A6A6UD47_9PEZI|nr:hypothetical protein BT63DRAFT_424047 [Microthyrium microscopicum]